MTTYTCKCGKTFGKNTGAGTTGFRMPDYGPEHECYGCPFVCKIMTWDPVTQQNAVQNYECRVSKAIRYDTTARINTSDKTVADILTLDFNFLQQVREFVATLDGFVSEHSYNGDFYKSSSCYSPDGRFRYPLYPEQNQKGIAAKAALKEHFFNLDGSRKDVTPEQEKEIVLNQIKEAKAMARGKDPATAGRKYYHFNLVYFVDQREDNGQYTVFMDDHQHPGSETVTPCATIPDFDTFEQAQNALDGYAIKRGFTDDPTERPTMEPVAPDDAEDDQPDTEGDQDVSENDCQDSEDDVNEIPDPDNDSGNSANDMPEEPQEPCDWKNASGADEDDEMESNVPAGELFSLMDDSMTNLINIFDDSINEALRVAVKAKQGFTFQAKIIFDYRSGAFAIKHDEQYQFDPIKVKTKGELAEEIQIVLDESGNPIIPYDRQHQMNFDELQPEREIRPTGTVTVDGNTGIVEGYQDGGEEPEDPPTSDDITNSVVEDDLESDAPAQDLSCDYDCPFFGVDDIGNTMCCFDDEDPGSSNYAGDVWEAVHMHGCQRQEVLDAYRQNDPENDSSEAPDEPETPENSEEDYAS